VYDVLAPETSEIRLLSQLRDNDDPGQPGAEAGLGERKQLVTLNGHPGEPRCLLADLDRVDVEPERGVAQDFDRHRFPCFL
jgi:hypothetical protein